MFDRCSSLIFSPKIYNWNIDNVTDIEEIFGEHPSSMKYSSSVLEAEKEKETQYSILQKLYPKRVYKSLCKIIYNNLYFIGFFIKLYKEEKQFYCLITTQNALIKKTIENKEKINIHYHGDKKELKIKLDKKERYIEYDLLLEITVIEIKLEDKIEEKYFLVPNLDNIYINHINEDIYLYKFTFSLLYNLYFIECSDGKIKDINNLELIYNGFDNKFNIEDFGGGPVFLKGTQKVIGVKKKGKTATLISSIIQLLNNKLKRYMKKIYENKECYIGEMINGLKHGKGKLYYRNGITKYEGDFAKDKFEGNGKLNYQNGDYYIGQFVNGLRQGKGKLYDKNGKIKYDGDFNDEDKNCSIF